jgi:hypothetical protein
MSELADKIDRLESQILAMIDEIEFFEHVGGSVRPRLKDELRLKRKELVKLKEDFEKEQESINVVRLKIV